MNIKPLADRVVVAPLEGQEERVGSIYIPDSAKEKPQEGKIIAVGPGKTEGGKLIPLSVNVGDRVLYGKYAGTEIKKDGKEVLIVKESDILAIIE